MCEDCFSFVNCREIEYSQLLSSLEKYYSVSIRQDGHFSGNSTFGSRLRRIMMQQTNRRYWIFAGLLLFCLLWKIVPHALGLSQFSNFLWNYSPLYAVCLLMGATCTAGRYSRTVRYLAPLLTMIISDVIIAFIGWYTERPELAFHKVQLVVNACFLMMVGMGWFLRNDRSALAIGEVGLASSIWFFVLTNFAMWALGDGKFYPHTVEGLLTCFVAAIPFFHHTLLAILIYLPLLFNPWVLAFIEGAEKTETLPAAATPLAEESAQPVAVNA